LPWVGVHPLATPVAEAASCVYCVRSYDLGKIKFVFKRNVDKPNATIRRPHLHAYGWLWYIHDVGLCGHSWAAQCVGVVRVCSTDRPSALDV